MQTKSWLPQDKDILKPLFSDELSREKVHMKIGDAPSCSATANKDAAESYVLGKLGLSLSFLLMVVLQECYSIMVVPEFWEGDGHTGYRC